jgi:hypothetical protein
VLNSVKNLLSYRVGTTDGLAGGIVDVYFNDQDWTVRHIVTSSHPTRLHKAALLPPAVIANVNASEQVLEASLSKEQVDALPSGASAVPVCRQYTMRSSSSSHGLVAADPHLRSAVAITGYEINDGEQHLGVMHDFLIDTRTWKVAFIVGRRFGAQEREFLVPVSAVGQISFASRRVAIRKFSHWDLVFEERNGYDRALEAQAA